MMIRKPQKTTQRAAIAAYMKDHRAHPSAGDVYDAVSKTITTISLATVYSNLLLLQKTGIHSILTLRARSGQRFDSFVFAGITSSAFPVIRSRISPHQPTREISQEYLHGFRYLILCSDMPGLQNENRGLV